MKWKKTTLYFLGVTLVVGGPIVMGISIGAPVESGLLWNPVLEDPTSQYMIVIDKRNNQVIPSFQKHAIKQPGILIHNAVLYAEQHGFTGTRDDFEEKRVSKETWNAYRNAYTEALRPAKEAAERAKREVASEIVEKVRKVLTPEEIKVFQKEIIEGRYVEEINL